MIFKVFLFFLFKCRNSHIISEYKKTTTGNDPIGKGKQDRAVNIEQVY